MCLKRDLNDRVFENKKPITTYKVMVRTISDKLVTPFMSSMLELNRLYKGKDNTKKFIANAKCVSNLIWEGYHSYPTEKDAESCYDWARKQRRNYMVCLVKCEIPRWSGVAYGKDDMKMPCVTSTRIILKEVIKSDRCIR